MAWIRMDFLTGDPVLDCDEQTDTDCIHRYWDSKLIKFQCRNVGECVRSVEITSGAFRDGGWPECCGRTMKRLERPKPRRT